MRVIVKGCDLPENAKNALYQEYKQKEWFNIDECRESALNSLERDYNDYEFGLKINGELIIIGIDPEIKQYWLSLALQSEDYPEGVATIWERYITLDWERYITLDISTHPNQYINVSVFKDNLISNSELYNVSVYINKLFDNMNQEILDYFGNAVEENISNSVRSIIDDSHYTIEIDLSE